MSRKLKNVIKYVLSLAVAALLMYFCFRGVNWTEFVVSLSGCRWWWVAASILAGVLSNWFRSERWREILLPVDGHTGHVTTFNAVNIGYLANFVFPRIGEFVRCGVISKDSKDGKASYDKVLGTVVTERSLDMIVMLLILFVFLLVKWDEFGTFFVDRMWIPLSQRLNFSLWWIVVAVVIIMARPSALLYVPVNAAPLRGNCGSSAEGFWTAS